MDFLQLVSDVGFPIAASIAAGYFVFLSVKFILNGVTENVNTLKGIIGALDNRVQTMNNDLVKIDALMSYTLGVKPNIDRLAANEGKEDARRDWQKVKNMFKWIGSLIEKIRLEIRYRKRLKELRKRDPFIYKWKFGELVPTVTMLH